MIVYHVYADSQLEDAASGAVLCGETGAAHKTGVMGAILICGTVKQRQGEKRPDLIAHTVCRQCYAIMCEPWHDLDGDWRPPVQRVTVSDDVARFASPRQPAKRIRKRRQR